MLFVRHSDEVKYADPLAARCSDVEKVHLLDLAYSCLQKFFESFYYRRRGGM